MSRMCTEGEVLRDASCTRKEKSTAEHLPGSLQYVFFRVMGYSCFNNMLSSKVILLLSLIKRHILCRTYTYKVILKWHTFLYALASSLTDFQTYFSVTIRRTFVIILSLKIAPLLKCVATLPCEKSTTENKTTSVATHFNKLTTGNNVFIISYYLK